MSAGPIVGDRLDRLVRERETVLRPASQVMSPAYLGAARPTRYSFSRTLLRRAAAQGWQASRPHFEMTAAGEGEVVYRIDTGSGVFSFFALTTTLDETEHTDRVIAERWEISGCLVEGEVDDALLAELRVEIPKQEDARLSSRVLVLTRGNRSVRFFDYLVDTLAQGHQPDAALVGDAGYIMRSTAFYGNGKFGMRSFDGYGEDHALRAPYRAQFLCAWLFRELSFDVVQHCAAAKGGSQAVGFDHAWSRFFGLGNATGLGLVPYGFKHPRVLHGWAAVRELALANVRALEPTDSQLTLLRTCIDRARSHFAEGTDADCTPFLSPAELVPVIEQLAAEFARISHHSHPFDSWYRFAETCGAEAAELAAALLIELDTDVDEIVDELLLVDEQTSIDPTITVARARSMLDDRFGWVSDLALDEDDAHHYWWVVSDNAEEPRRTPTSKLAPGSNAVCIDIAHQMAAFGSTLHQWPETATLAAVLADHHEHLQAAERLMVSDRLYGEIRDNACAATYLPLQIQRFQLAMYGMDNFKPKSTDWLRVTLFQGAPRLTDLHDPETMLADSWAFPALPTSGQTGNE